MDFPRSGGLLLHISSLPGPWGIGTLGAEAHDFIRFLARGGQTLWQVLPLGPTGFGNSPYSALSACAGNPLLIGFDEPLAKGWISRAALRPGSRPRGQTVDYGPLLEWKPRALTEVWRGFERGARASDRQAFEEFREVETGWLDDFALFMALKRRYGERPWFRWPAPLRRREAAAIHQCRAQLGDAIRREQFLQFLFFRQWQAVKEHANRRGIRVIGDLPLYIAHDSADAWVNPAAFGITRGGRPSFVGGVPPDSFARTGQLWGNTVYDWAQMKRDGFRWWVDRVRANLRLYDILRLDHFVGLVNYWAVPFAHKTAERGTWVRAPGEALMAALRRALGELPFVVEDLGNCTPPVARLRERYGFPSMKILQYAFGGSAANDHLPHNQSPNTVIYTGTHDNDAMLGWYRAAGQRERAFARRYAGLPNPAGVAWSFVRLAWSSPARLAVVPLQDVLGLGSRSRMNHPGTTSGNWTWRMPPGALTPALAARLRTLSRTFGR